MKAGDQGTRRAGDAKEKGNEKQRPSSKKEVWF
jgi:hypothetical protein